jgi:serralysin
MAVINGTSSNDNLIANPGDELRGLDGDDTLTGSTGNERLRGGNGNDVLNGGDGDDELDGGPGADTMNGGFGNDSYVVDNVGDVIDDPDQARINAYVDFNLSSVTGGATKLTLSLLSSGIVGTGSSGNDLIVSYATNTTLNGGDGNDTLKGSSKSKVYGGAGNDFIESAGISTLIGGAGDDYYNVYYVGDLVIDEKSDGGSGIDTIFTTLDFSLAGQTGVKFIGAIENLTLAVTSLGGPIRGTGNEHNNVIIGNRQNNILNGLSGNDTIYASLGDDTIDGGDGNDQLFGEKGNDLLIGGLGADTLSGSEGNDIYTADVNDTIIEGIGQGIDTVNLTGSNGTFITSAEVEFINITGLNSIHVILSNSNDTVVNGNRAGNIIEGGAGDDTLRGYAGADRLTGGLGSDVFEFGGVVNGIALKPTGNDNNSIWNDTVTDFNSSQGDKIHLSASTFTVLAGFVGSDLTGLAKGFVSDNGNTTRLDLKDAYFVYNTANGLLYYNENLTVAGTSGAFATFTSVPSLAPTDFLIIA